LARKEKTDESRSNIIIDFQGVTGLLTTVADRIFHSEVSISYTQYTILLIIASLKSPVNEGLVAEKFHRGLNTVSMIVDRMVKSGLIDRTRSTHDRRKCIVSLTILGKDKLAKGKRLNDTLSKKLFNILDDKEVQDIHHLLGKLEKQAVQELSV
jgi:MarR family transcriptional regulator, organic hydroperoxide resistance regulator